MKYLLTATFALVLTAGKAQTTKEAANLIQRLMNNQDAQEAQIKFLINSFAELSHKVYFSVNNELWDRRDEIVALRSRIDSLQKRIGILENPGQQTFIPKLRLHPNDPGYFRPDSSAIKIGW